RPIQRVPRCEKISFIRSSQSLLSFVRGPSGIRLPVDGLSTCSCWCLLSPVSQAFGNCVVKRQRWVTIVKAMFK
ncbi:unnamed protein product, partial [Nesidiocoris tenuis]